MEVALIDSGGWGSRVIGDQVLGSRRSKGHDMTPPSPQPVVHLELQTANLPRACAFYAELFAWRAELIQTGYGTYVGLDLGDGVEGGVVERDAVHPLWLPYVRVPDITRATERARRLGASVRLEAREGPAGWRSIVAAPDGGDVALWQPKS
jgi:predicted enzyme related to lactoylglutathione lyase